MLYLEDYLEMIEHLPQELRDRFTEMREMDLSVQNNMDTLEKRVRTLFGGCRRGDINTEQANTEFTDIKRGYNKTLEEADEKMALANQMYDLVDRYLRRLDTELHKFKCELEADNKGITELLEKRSLDLDVNTNHTSTSNNNHYKDNRYRIRAEKRRDSWGNRESRGHASGNLSRTDSAIQAALGRDSYSLGHAGSAIAAAASQAIAATQQMQYGRRTASLKASYEAVAGGELAHHATLQTHHTHHDHGHGMSSSHTQSNSVHGHHTTSHGHNNSASSTKRNKQKKSNSYSSSSVAAHSTQAVASTASRSSSPTVVPLSTVVNNVAIEEPMEEEWTYDPNEPRYCICNQVSYGDMVACDNQDCPYEWFHYPCVGITAPPKGKWYCPQCQTNMRRNRAHRKN
ncbi:unnamed protein product [Chrysodeixis includens]|uniref:Inhibitor of growth protein n=1 Tax=Chrysodeixis includens TaxID=689277 RepID=A0A9P0FU35_CHRIL|nr:unnamed protein product [Chrysodeixis includens]